MNGSVDRSGRALLVLRVGSTNGGDTIDLTLRVDTAFTGELVVPRQTVERLGMMQSSAVTAGLADGSEVVLETYSCVIEWFGEQRMVEVVANDGQFPLLAYWSTARLQAGNRLPIANPHD